jgi:hypothetical protein
MTGSFTTIILINVTGMNGCSTGDEPFSALKINP